MQLTKVNNINFAPAKAQNHTVSNVYFKGGIVTLDAHRTTTKKESRFSRLKNRYLEIKKYNPTKNILIKAMMLDEANYKKIIDVLNVSLNRKTNPNSQKPNFDFNCSKENYDGIIEERIDLGFMDLGFLSTLGYYSSLNTTNESATLDAKRTTYEKDGRKSSELIDKSRLNPNVYIENQFKEVQIRSSEGIQETTNRRIEIKDKNYQPLLTYYYSRKEDTNRNTVTYDVNGKSYDVTVRDNGIIIITSGQKGRIVDLSKKIEGFTKGKETLIQALRMLPPQILFGIDENFTKIVPTKSKNHYEKQTMYVNTYDPYITSRYIINTTMEKLCRLPKLTTNKNYSKQTTRKNSLMQDKKLNSIFKEEQIAFLHWLFSESDGNIAKNKNSYTKNTPEHNELMEIIKAVCDMLWMQEYEDTKSAEEAKRLLLNFFPKTVSYIVTQFELNAL